MQKMLLQNNDLELDIYRLLPNWMLTPNEAKLRIIIRKSSYGDRLTSLHMYIFNFYDIARNLILYRYSS